ncbi:MAG: methyl-accepting chemotaxis protein [Rhodospirillaceae bacterium]
MTNLLSNLSLRWKLLLIVIVFAVTTIPLFVLSHETIREQRETISSVLFAEFDQQDQLTGLALALAKSSAMLYRVAAVGSAGISEAKSNELLAVCRQQLKAVETAFGRLKSGAAGGAARDRASALEGGVGKYRKALEDVLEMIDSDPATALAMLAHIVDIEAALQKQVDDMTEAEKGTVASVKGATTASANRALSILLLAGLFAYALSFLVSRLLAEVIHRGISGTTTVMAQLAAGDLEVEIPHRSRGDEVGAMARAVEVFKTNAQEMAGLRAEQERSRQQAEAEKRRLMTRLADQFESSVKAVVSAVSSSAHQMQSTAAALAAAADQSSRQSQAVAAAADQASSNVQTVAAATEELTASVSEISRRVTESSRMAVAAVDEANRTNATITSLSEAAQKIGEVVQLINDIASQTNLLALNATIEAARAGEAGKGFAVVASEVKNLANQTARATDDIQAQVGQMQSVTGTAVEAIRGIGGTIRVMSEISATIASAVEQQGAAIQEIARNVTEAARGTEEVSGNIGGINQAAGEARRMAGEALGAAKDLSRQSDILSREVDGFTLRVRSA